MYKPKVGEVPCWFDKDGAFFDLLSADAFEGVYGCPLMPLTIAIGVGGIGWAVKRMQDGERVDSKGLERQESVRRIDKSPTTTPR